MLSAGLLTSILRIADVKLNTLTSMPRLVDMQLVSWVHVHQITFIVILEC